MGMGRGSRIMRRGSWLLRRGSCVVGSASWVVRHGWWVVGHELKTFPKFLSYLYVLQNLLTREFWHCSIRSF